MAKPVKLPTWSTDTNYPAGADPWSATPVKVEPTSGKKAEGWEPSEKPPAQWQNYWQNLVHQWVEYFCSALVTHIPVQSGRQVAGTAMSFGADDTAGESVTTSNTDNVYRIYIPTKEGTQLNSISMVVTTLNAGDQVTITLKKCIAGAGASTVGSPDTSSGAPTTDTLLITGLTEDIGTAGICYYLAVTVPAFNTGTLLYGPSVTTSIPVP